MTGVEKTDAGSREFALYSADQYAAPTHGSFETVQSVDGTAWYKQYAQDTVEKRRMNAGNGKSPTTNPLSRSSRRHPSERTGCKWRSKAPALGKLSM